ncbi:hypothetical protein A3Q56_03430 [Intoshia linei]|uniref:[RNA-polymerase]-subunit kinase n=1 Tax=Intoshia linei TaxID=1819745 RepID=A0A177B5W7_9BILA|nr:hypothetical protein A3Q56_03430 [Intoshia linei]
MSGEMYTKLDILGSGRFATVYEAKNKETGQIVAIKKINVGSRDETQYGINRTAYREIKLLGELNHENIIKLLDVYSEYGNICLVFEHMDTDLFNIIENRSIIFKLSHIKNYTKQLCTGLHYLHKNWILHRDLKPDNLLLRKTGLLTITDFGLARTFASPDRIYTNQVVTRWYRCPELIMGAKKYGPAVDMWSVGCIIAQLFLRVPLISEDSDIQQLATIVKIFGLPDEENWPFASNFSSFIKFNVQQPVPLKSIFTAVDDDSIDFITKLLVLNPLKRFTSLDVLHSNFLNKNPMPCDNNELPFDVNSKDTTQPSVKRQSDSNDEYNNYEIKSIYYFTMFTF